MQQEPHPMGRDFGPISWWSWRPGIQPRNALIIGGLIALVALLLASIGLIALILSILDSMSPSLLVPGVVIKHTVNGLDGQPQLVIRVHTIGFPTEVSPTVSSTVSGDIHDGEHIVLDYSPRLHVLYALESGGRRYVLPDSSTVSNLVGAVTLLLLGSLLLPYPAILASWGWRDVYGYRHGRYCEMKAQVVGLRMAAQTRVDRRTGLVPRVARPWYGMAIYPLDTVSEGQVRTFAVSEAMYRRLHEGDVIRVRYSPCVHYVYEVSTKDIMKSVGE